MSMPAARRRLVFASLIHERDPQVRVTEPPEAAAGVAAAILEGRSQPSGLLLQEARERRAAREDPEGVEAVRCGTQAAWETWQERQGGPS